MVRLRLTLNLALAIVVTLACCESAGATATQWGAETVVARDVDFGTIGIDGAGAVTALYQATSPKRVMVAHAAPGGDFSDPLPFGPDCSVLPQLVENDAGDAIGLWERYPGWAACPDVDTSSFGVRFREPGGGFGPVQTFNGGPAQIAMNASGQAVLPWGEDGALKVATRLPGGRFGPATVLSGPGAAYPGAVCDGMGKRVTAAINDGGDEMVVWSYWSTAGCKNAKGGAFAAYRPAGGTFGRPEPLPEPGDSDSVSLAPDGTATIVFSRPINQENDTAALTRAPNGDYSAVRSLGVRGDTQVSTDESGRALFWWLDGAGAVFQNYGAMQQPDGTLTRFRLLHAGLQMQLALDSSGNVLTTWEDPPDFGAPGEGQAFHAAIVNHLVLADSPDTLAPEVSGGKLDNPAGIAVNDDGGAAVGYRENTDYSVYPPPIEFRVVRRAADVAPPAVDSPAAETDPAAVTLEAKCDEICRLRSNLTVSASSSGDLHAASRAKPVIALATHWVTRRRGHLARQTISVGPKARKRMRKLRRAGAHLKAVASIRAEDAWRNARVVHRQVRLDRLLAP